MASDTHILTLASEAAQRFRQSIVELHRPLHTYAQSLAAFDGATPEVRLPEMDVIAGLIERAGPGLHATTSSRFFGWVIGGSHPVGVAADWLTSAWGQNAGNHTASPAAAASEAVSAKWLLDILQLPAEASVGFVTGATVANFVCLCAARAELLRRTGWNPEIDGVFGAPPIRIIIGDEAHSTVFAGLHYLGFGEKSITRVPSNAQGAMDADAFRKTLATVKGPVLVITQAGQINTGAFDPHIDIIAASRAHSNCWIHVDGAFGLWARACPDRVDLTAAIETADSWATDGHKWLQTPYDCGFAIVRDAEAHRRAMTIAASYLPPVGEGVKRRAILSPDRRPILTP